MSLYKPQGWKRGKKFAAYSLEFTVYVSCVASSQESCASALSEITVYLWSGRAGSCCLLHTLRSEINSVHFSRFSGDHSVQRTRNLRRKRRSKRVSLERSFKFTSTKSKFPKRRKKKKKLLARIRTIELPRRRKRGKFFLALNDRLSFRSAVKTFGSYDRVAASA